MYRIARNVALDWRRTASRTAALHQDLAGADPAEGIAHDDISVLAPDDALMRCDMQQCLGRVVHELPESYRKVLTLRDVEGLSTAAVAKALGLSLATVKVRLHRARGHLRRTMTDRCVVSHDGRRGLTCERKPPS